MSQRRKHFSKRPIPEIRAEAFRNGCVWGAAIVAWGMAIGGWRARVLPLVPAPPITFDCEDAGDGTCTLDHQQSETTCALPGGYATDQEWDEVSGRRLPAQAPSKGTP